MRAAALKVALALEKNLQQRTAEQNSISGIPRVDVASFGVAAQGNEAVVSSVEANRRYFGLFLASARHLASVVLGPVLALSLSKRSPEELVPAM
jgi:hypothetical protein